MWCRKLTPFAFVGLLVCIYPSCTKPFTISGLNAVAQASLTDTTGNCLPNDVAGTFYDGITPGADTAYIQITVNVASAGSYTITSNSQDGVYFTASGTFINTGINTVKLQPVGTPTTIGTYNFSMTLDTSTCYFNLAVKDSTGTGLGKAGASAGAGSWQFSAAAGDTTSGSNATGTLVSSGSINDLVISGNDLSGDTAINISITLPSSTIPSSGQYSCAAGNVTLQVTALGGPVYSGINVSGVTLQVNITSYNSSTKELVGNFSGVVKTAGGQNATLSSGSFDVIVQ